jgi:putative oxidoreductase
MEKYLNLAGRILLAQLFLVAGIGKIGAYAGTQAYMASVGVPGPLLPLVILLEVGGALTLALGWQTRLTALALAAFSLASAALFHTNFGDQVQMIMFMKNLAIAGGLLAVAAQNPLHGLSLDGRRSAAGRA